MSTETDEKLTERVAQKLKDDVEAEVREEVRDEIMQKADGQVAGIDEAAAVIAEHAVEGVSTEDIINALEPVLGESDAPEADAEDAEDDEDDEDDEKDAPGELKADDGVSADATDQKAETDLSTDDLLGDGDAVEQKSEDGDGSDDLTTDDLFGGDRA